MRYYDEKYHKNLIIGNFEKLRNIAIEKAKELIDYGWIDMFLEGGVVSPDLSTIFIYGRSPYNGQYLQFRPELKTEFKKIIHNAKAFEIVETK